MSRIKSSLMKRRHRSIIAFEMIRLDRTSTEPLHLQLYRQIRDELKLGSFGDGASRLPSSRALAADLGIARLFSMAVVGGIRAGMGVDESKGFDSRDVV
jgi:hypothetical protein